MTGAAGDLPAWPFLARPGNNGRYWLLPMLAFVAALAWLAASRGPLAVRAGAAALLAVSAWGAAASATTM